MFGVAFSEVAVVALVALVVVGPKKLPVMLRTAGEWVGRLRKLTNDMRAQTGIDAILREEGIDGVQELRALLRGEIQAARDRHDYSHDEPSPPAAEDEYPVEGPDVCGAMADDLFDVPPAPHAAPPHAASLGAQGPTNPAWGSTP